jgi:putative NADH-flavin reductase
MKHILLLGATGFVGQAVLAQLLSENYEVTILIRENNKAIQVKQNLKIIIGSVLNATDVQKALSKQDAVLDCLGNGSKAEGEQNTFTSDAARIIVQEMEKTAVRRLICMSNVGTVASKSPWYFRKIIMPLFLRKLIPIIKDKERLDKIVKKSNLDYTIVYFHKIKNSKELKKIKTSTEGKGIGFSISVIDCAKFLISQIDDSRFIKKSLSASN